MKATVNGNDLLVWGRIPSGLYSAPTELSCSLRREYCLTALNRTVETGCMVKVTSAKEKLDGILFEMMDGLGDPKGVHCYLVGPRFEEDFKLFDKMPDIYERLVAQGVPEHNILTMKFSDRCKVDIQMDLRTGEFVFKESKALFSNDAFLKSIPGDLAWLRKIPDRVGRN